MLDKKLMILGGATGTTAVAGGTGAAIHFSLNGESSNEEFDSNEPKSSGEGTDGGQSEEVQQKQKGEETGPGRDVVDVQSLFETVKKKLEKLDDKEKCERHGWRWNDADKCSIPEKIEKMAHLGIEPISPAKNNMEECINAGGYWWDEEATNKKCKTRNIVFRGKFKRSLNGWEPIEEQKIDEKLKNGPGILKTLNSSGHWEIKRHGDDYAIIFKQEKILLGPKKDWNFPSYYYTHEGAYADTGMICRFLNELAEETADENRRGLYLYNENTKNFWDCKLGGFTFIAY